MIGCSKDRVSCFVLADVYVMCVCPQSSPCCHLLPPSRMRASKTKQDCPTGHGFSCTEVRLGY